MQVLSLEDIMVWPDGTWCYREDLRDMTHMSDDYTVLIFDSADWHVFDKE
jgi:hypothetical protein